MRQHIRTVVVKPIMFSFSSQLLKKHANSEICTILCSEVYLVYKYIHIKLYIIFVFNVCWW